MSILRACPTALASFLSADPVPFVNADLYTVTLVDGTVLYWTSSDVAVSSNGHLFSNSGPTLTRSAWGVRNTVAVPQLKIKLRCDNSKTVEGIPIKRAFHDGIFDGATWRLERAYIPKPDGIEQRPVLAALGVILLFEGSQGAATVTGIGVDVVVTPEPILFNQYMPRNLYQTGCVWTLYSEGCGIAKASFTFSFTVGASPAPSSLFIPWSSAPSPFAPFGLGTIAMASGAADGQRRTIESADATGLTLAYPLYDVPAPGDSFDAAYGCDKTEATCDGVFSNLANILDFPFIPVPETAI